MHDACLPSAVRKKQGKRPMWLPIGLLLAGRQLTEGGGDGQRLNPRRVPW